MSTTAEKLKAAHDAYKAAAGTPEGPAAFRVLLHTVRAIQAEQRRAQELPDAR